MNDLESLLGGLLSGMKDSENSDNNNSPDSEGNAAPDIDIDKLLKLTEILSKLGENDKNTDLLIALKPYLKEENRAKIDSAVKLIRLASILPYLKDSGILGNLF